MFRPRDPQSSLLTSSVFMTERMRDRIERDWPGQFRRAALPMIDEDLFRDFYHADNGRPNKAVQIVVGVLILKEMFDLTDEEALGSLSYDLRWHMALDLRPEEAQCCQKTLHTFRRKLYESDRARLLFRDVVGKMVAALGIDTARQRLDSTHIVSNIARLTRLGLFCETLRVFLKELKYSSKKRFRSIPESLVARYLKADGSDSSYHDAKSNDAYRRMAVCARDVWRLVTRFRGDRAASKLESYGLLERLLADQCEAVKDPQLAAEGDADVGEGGAPVVVKDARKVRSDSLQSPHDPDMTYSGHKGKGCEVQIAETVGNGEKPEVITYADVTRSCDDDDNATLAIVEDLAEAGMQPTDLMADSNYASTDNAIELERRGTELVAPVHGGAETRWKDGEISEADQGAERRLIAKGEFDIDVKGERPARCPAGCNAIEERCEAGTGRARLVFDARACESCPMADRCPAKRQKDGSRILKTRLYDSVVTRRRRYQRTEEFRERYRQRAGVESTHSELKRKHGLGRPRVRRLPRVRLLTRMKALACNIKRMVVHLAEEARIAARTFQAEPATGV